jgi:serine/threonine-protein kinase RsbW
MTAEENVVTFPSETENIRIVENLIDRVLSEYKVGEEFYGNILISLTEAVNNAIVHGNKLDPSKQVHLSYNIAGKTLIFKVEDEGPGFDYSTLPDPTSPENIEKPNGRGVFLMRHLADRCEFLEDGKIVSLEFDAIPV